jgi:ABC-type dipeptide/oligopeptide/nickel transport system ATPase component
MKETKDKELLVVKNLRLHFRTTRGPVQAVDGLTLNCRETRRL